MPEEHNFIENEIVILSKQTIDLLLKQKDPSKCMALYVFYYYTAKWQKTNQPKASIEYVSRGLKWNEDTVRKYKKILIELGLISEVKRLNSDSKKVEGWYIKLNYIWKQENHPPLLPGGGSNQRVDLEGTNALSANNLNALSANKKDIGEVVEEILIYWNLKHNTKYRSGVAIKDNVEYWLEYHSLEDIKQAIDQLLWSPFWKDKMTPIVMFRRRNPRGEDVDYIEELINIKPEKNF